MRLFGPGAILHEVTGIGNDGRRAFGTWTICTRPQLFACDIEMLCCSRRCRDLFDRNLIEHVERKYDGSRTLHPQSIHTASAR